MTTPQVEAFAFDATDEAAIGIAMQSEDPWTNAAVADLKRRLKQHCISRGQWQCCYCRRSLLGEFLLVIDIEHILPKASFPKFTFDLLNLAASCKRCNMDVKRSRTDFLVDRATIDARYAESTSYHFVHPNLDRYFDHLHRREECFNAFSIVKYSVVDGSTKGKYTYDFFRLKEFEVESFDRAQGIDAIGGDGVPDLRRKVEEIRTGR